MSPPGPFEVTQLIDFALDRSTSVARACDFAHFIAMVNRKFLECIRTEQITGWIQAVGWRKNELYGCSTEQERLDFIFQSSERDFLHSRPCTTLDKKKNHPRDSRREERCSMCDIMLDQAQSAQGKSRGSDLPGANRASSSMISHVEQRSSRRESR